MRALTLTQPWLGLIAAGLKPDENRPRKMIKREDFGEPFALHAGDEVSKKAIRRIIEIAPELCADPRQLWWRLGSIVSAVVAVATIERCCILHDGWLYDLHTKDRVIAIAERRWAFGPFVYMLRDIRALPVPVACRGWQGFWTLKPEHEARVVAQLVGVS